MKAPRKLRFNKAGWVVTIASIMLGLAAMATGNNLLFLLLGAMLGLIGLSGWMSELTLRGADVRRIVPRQLVAGERGVIRYEVANRNRRVPVFAISIMEDGFATPDGANDAAPADTAGFVAMVAPHGAADARVPAAWRRRGTYRLDAMTIATSFPFGLFEKSREISSPDEVVVVPRCDLRLRQALPFGRDDRSMGAVTAGAVGARGEFAGLRQYRVGDDPRDIHWRSTARAGEPVIREYAPERALGIWICLDTQSMGDEELAERAVECAATLAAQATRTDRPVGLAVGEVRLAPSSGASQLAKILRVLAGVTFQIHGAAPAPPADPNLCILVTASGASESWGDVFTPTDFG